jgi:peptide/nickel transport system permease protein
MLVLVSAAFLMIHAIPGDPVRTALGITASPALVAERRHQLGLDRPLVVQFGHFVHGVFTGNLGASTTAGLPVRDVISERLPATATLAILAFGVAMLVGLAAGMSAAIRAHNSTRPDRSLVFGSTTGVLATTPEFVLAYLLVFLFAITWHIFPVGGRAGPSSYVLPVAALSLAPAAALARVVRVETIRVLNQDYVRMAKAKRLPSRLLYLRHALPNLLTATLTVGGLLLTGLVAGTVLVENVFAWPGMGTALVQGILDRDYALVQGFALVYGATVLLVNLVVDLLIAVTDPRSTILDS